MGIVGSALDSFTSYLTDRKQFVTLSGHHSFTSDVTHGVPQGSVLGPLLFIIYMLPLGKIIRHFNLDFQCYVDDTQTNSPFKPLLAIWNCASQKSGTG